jgi:hypothetical protein
MSVTKIYGVYAPSHDITFVMRETYNDKGDPEKLAVTGFYFGEPEDQSNIDFDGDLEAEFDLLNPFEDISE